MARYGLHQRHEARLWGVAYAAFTGVAPPLRRRPVVASCLSGGHEMWWLVEAGSSDEALAQLPHFLATRATAIPITEVQIP